MASGTVPTGGIVIPVTVNAAPAASGDAQSADYTLPNPLSISIAAGAASGSLTVATVDDTLDELRERIRFGVGTLPTDVSFAGGSFDATNSNATIIDADPTTAVISGGGTVTEQDTSAGATLTVSLSRPLRVQTIGGAAETATLALRLRSTTGVALTHYTLTASGTGMTPSGLNTATPSLVFTGHNTNTVQTATLTITPTNTDDGNTAEDALIVEFATTETRHRLTFGLCLVPSLPDIGTSIRNRLD